MKKLREFLDDYWTSGLERLRDVAEAAQRNADQQNLEPERTGHENAGPEKKEKH